MTFFLSGKRYSYTGSLQLLEGAQPLPTGSTWWGEEPTCPFFSYVPWGVSGLMIKKLDIKSAEIRVNIFKKVIQLKMQLFACSSECAWGSLIFQVHREKPNHQCCWPFFQGWLPKSQQRRCCQRGHWGFRWPEFSVPCSVHTKVRYHPSLPKHVLHQEYSIQCSGSLHASSVLINYWMIWGIQGNWFLRTLCLALTN